MNESLLINIIKYLISNSNLEDIKYFLLISNNFTILIKYFIKKKIKLQYPNIKITNLILTYIKLYHKYYFIKLSCCKPFGNFNEYGYFSIVNNKNKINKTINNMINKFNYIYSPILTIGIINIYNMKFSIIYFKRNFNIPIKINLTKNVIYNYKFTYIWYYQVKEYINELPLYIRI